MIGKWVGFDLRNRCVILRHHNLEYDNLLLAVDGGSRGVELVGFNFELALRFSRPEQQHFLALETRSRLLLTFSELLSPRAEKQLRELEVEIRTNAPVSHMEVESVSFSDE